MNLCAILTTYIYDLPRGWSQIGNFTCIIIYCLHYKTNSHSRATYCPAFQSNSRDSKIKMHFCDTYRLNKNIIYIEKEYEFHYSLHKDLMNNWNVGNGKSLTLTTLVLFAYPTMREKAWIFFFILLFLLLLLYSSFLFCFFLIRQDLIIYYILTVLLRFFIRFNSSSIWDWFSRIIFWFVIEFLISIKCKHLSEIT